MKVVLNLDKSCIKTLAGYRLEVHKWLPFRLAFRCKTDGKDLLIKIYSSFHMFDLWSGFHKKNSHSALSIKHLFFAQFLKTALELM